MCCNTTASNTGRVNGTCTLLETVIGRNLLWMACCHHMFEVLLADALVVCLGKVFPSTGPEILFFKWFKDKWLDMNHRQPKPRSMPLIYASDKLEDFITEKLQLVHPRDDCRELLSTRGIYGWIERFVSSSQAWCSSQSALDDGGNICDEDWIAFW